MAGVVVEAFLQSSSCTKKYKCMKYLRKIFIERSRVIWMGGVAGRVAATRSWTPHNDMLPRGSF